MKATIVAKNTKVPHRLKLEGSIMIGTIFPTRKFVVQLAVVVRVMPGDTDIGESQGGVLGWCILRVRRRGGEVEVEGVLLLFHLCYHTAGMSILCNT